ncbi:MAG: hypothetical protein IPK93_03360 [Solirubrobacterales bacterium]|nr:hypothetical protein [Solirubrobacterales bacterium]
MIVALLALFVALGGSSYAALKVNGKVIVKRSIAGKKLKKSTLTTREVKNKSLLQADFKPGQIPSGATGATGAAGPPGAAGANGAPGATSVVMRMSAEVSANAGSFATASAHCLSGETATGGGAYNEAQVLSMNVTSSYPLPNPGTSPATGDGIPATGWKVWMGNKSGTTEPFQAYVMCASP